MLWVKLPLKSGKCSGSTRNNKKHSVYKYCKKKKHGCWQSIRIEMYFKYLKARGILAMWSSITNENMKKPVHNC